MSDLFDNAIDSLKVGIEFYLQENYKHAILNIYHSIELFLKEKLFIINPILIYKNIDKPINDDSLTVSLNDILSRFSNLSICLEKEKK
ncbi:hypothetical protein KKB18_04815, partial [bacterium]|nr:hypothetical protein [bacterium]